ncbi:transporter [Salinisphaera sp.]|uniref:transporter n=1 Tax=Salinisphaera sp. TaxID=1914330 RepID=UPI0025D6F050|nr:transporter [Salinisphaera sp.]
MNKNGKHKKLQAAPLVVLMTTGALWHGFAVAQSQPAESGAPEERAPQVSEQAQPVGVAPEDELQPAEATEVLDTRGVLTPKNSLIFEPSLSMSYSSSNRVAIEAFTIIPAIAVGLIDVREVRRETLTAAAAFRYGITDRFEIEARVPYVWRRDEVRQRALLEPTSDDVIIDSDGDGIGDIEAALHYQLNMPDPGNAYYIGNLRVKSRTGDDIFEVEREFVMDDDVIVGQRLAEQPTGSGFWALEPSLTFILPTDPAVFFGNIGYTWNFERDVGGDIGRVDPGDFLNLSFGMGFGVNEKTSFSMGYDHTVVFDTEYKDLEATQNVEFDRVHVGNLLLGFSHRFSKTRSLNISLGIGVTEEAPDVQLTLKMPLKLF